MLDLALIALRYEDSCSVCMGWLETPVELSCGNLVCSGCCGKWIDCSEDASTCSCPCCYNLLDEDHISPVSQCTLRLLNIRRRGHPHGQSPTISEILSKPTTAPTTPAEKKVAENLIKRMMEEGNSPIIKVPTKGQVCN